MELRSLSLMLVLVGSCSFFFSPSKDVSDESYGNNCTDGVDNDGDGALDCLDADCALSPLCGAPEECTDGDDNDLDTLIDCQDPDCDSSAPCIEDCFDAIDNDGNGLIDCADPDCAGFDACLEICNNGIDDNLDGHVDCADADCVADPICVPVCGDGFVQPGEECDGAATHVCSDFGVTGATPGCDFLCRATCSVCSNDGKVCLDALAPIDLSGSPESMTVANLNGDGIDDVALILVDNAGARSLSILLSTSDGKFKQQPISLLNKPLLVRAVNRAIRDDLIVFVSSGNNAQAGYLQNQLATNPNDPFPVAFLSEVVPPPIDAVVEATPNALPVLDVSFASTNVRRYPISTSGFLPVQPLTFLAEDLELGDANNDGEPDIAYTSNATTPLGLVALSPAFTPVQFFQSSNPCTEVAVADLDNDGFDDVAVVDASPQTSQVPLRTFNSNTGLFDAYTTSNIGLTPQSHIELLHANLDTLQDLVSISGSTNTIQIFAQDAAHDFSVILSSATANSPTELAVGDFAGPQNIPGLRDVVVLFSESQQLQFFHVVRRP